MNNRLSITTAALLATLSLPALAQTDTPASPHAQGSVRAVQGEQGVTVLSNRGDEAASATAAAPEETAEGTAAASEHALVPQAAPLAPPIVVEAAPLASADAPAPKSMRQYVVAALAALAVVVLSMFVLALVRGRRRRQAERANPSRPLDISKRHIILSRNMALERDEDEGELPEAPPPASIRTPINPSPVVSESRTPTAPLSQPRATSKPTSDLAAAMLRATAPPPPSPASQRQWLSQRPTAMAAAKDSR